MSVDDRYCGIKVGDRVIVPPRTMLGLTAAGGPGTVTALRHPDELDVTLDSGERRTPRAYFVELEER